MGAGRLRDGENTPDLSMKELGYTYLLDWPMDEPQPGLCVNAHALGAESFGAHYRFENSTTRRWLNLTASRTRSISCVPESS